MNTDEFKGKGVIVIGADVGVGPAVYGAFRDAGAIVNADFTLDGAISSAATEATAIEQTLDSAIAKIGRLDILVLSARPVQTAGFLDMAPDRIRRVIEEELITYALIMQAAARRMVPQGWGRIINLLSMSGKTGVHHHVGPYAAAKGGVIALSRVMAAELASSGVTVNSVATALFEPQVMHQSEQRRQEMARGIPVGRFGRPNEAAHAVMFLASQDAGFVTGETMNLSGGRFMD